MKQILCSDWLLDSSVFSPYQAVTGKIYHLKQPFLLPATAWRFTKIKKSRFKKKGSYMYIIVWSDLILTKKINKYIWQST